MYKTHPSGRRHLKFKFVPEAVTVVAHFELLVSSVNPDGERTSPFFAHW